MPYSSLAVADYIVRRAAQSDQTVTPMQLIKLVYICHGWNLGLRGEPLIAEPVEAWKYGPVVRKLYHAVKSFGSSPVTSISGVPKQEFLSEETEIMNKVIDFYGKFSGVRLSQMTHMPGSPWSITTQERGIDSIVSNDVIEEFYARQARGDLPVARVTAPEAAAREVR